MLLTSEWLTLPYVNFTSNVLKDIARTKSSRFLSLLEKSEDPATLGSHSWRAAVSWGRRRPPRVRVRVRHLIYHRPTTLVDPIGVG